MGPGDMEGRAVHSAVGVRAFDCDGATTIGFGSASAPEKAWRVFSRLTLRLVRPTLGVAVLGGVFGFPAMASAAPTLSGFTASPGDSAGWVNGVDAPGDTDGQAIRLSIPTLGSAEVDLGNLGSTPPSSPPAFVARSSSLEFALVEVDISFSDYVQVTTDWVPHTADAWTLVDGPASMWSATVPGNGSDPPCDIRNVTYQQAIACPLSRGAAVSGAVVRAVLDTPDSPGLPGPDVYVDDLSYNGTTFTTGGSATAVTVTNPWVCEDPAGAYDQGFNAGFDPGFHAGYRAGFQRGYRVGFGRSGDMPLARAQAVPRQALPPACDQAFNQGFNTGFNPGFDSGFNRGFDTGFTSGFKARHRG